MPHPLRRLPGDSYHRYLWVEVDREGDVILEDDERYNRIILSAEQARELYRYLHEAGLT